MGLNVVVMGPPGAGKGTQAHFIREKFAMDPKLAKGDGRPAIRSLMNSIAQNRRDQGWTELAVQLV